MTSTTLKKIPAAQHIMTGEDPKATGGLVSNLPHPRVNKTKQHTVPSVSKIVTQMP